MQVLVTGGLGYIGSHVVVQLCLNNISCVILDNESNSSRNVLAAIKKITGQDVTYYSQDLQDEILLRHVFENHHFTHVIHLAGHKSVSESVEMPLDYYTNNIGCTLTLLRVMREKQVKNLIFSSSATVYAPKNNSAVLETDALAPSSPYGQTKFMIEQIISDLGRSDSSWSITILRYFNPIGGHPSGLLGDNPTKPNNLAPVLSQVAICKKPFLTIFGDDYKTDDGTCERDYVHVMDIANGHVCALKAKNALNIYNLGTGKPTSVFDLLHAFEKACGFPIPYKIGTRRSGDIDSVYADVSLAARELQWLPSKTLADMCSDAWNFTIKNTLNETKEKG